MGFRIVITRRDCITDLDGINRFIFSLADGFSALGNDVHVVSHSFKKNVLSEGTCIKTLFGVEGNIHVHALESNFRRKSWLRIAFAWATKGSKLINELNADAVIINGAIPLRVNKPRVIVNHGLNKRKRKGLNEVRARFYSQIGRYMYRRYADFYVCVSKRLSREINEYLGINCSVVPLPVKLHLFKNPPQKEREDLILHVGTRKGKNAETSILATAALIKNYSNAKLFVIGPNNNYISHLAEKYKNMIPHNLEFIFDANIFVISNLMAKAKVLVLPSKFETFPYAVLEGFASGLPAVVSNAVPEELVENGGNGFIVSDFNPNEYAENLLLLLRDADLWNFMSHNAFRTVSTFSHIEVAKIYERILEVCLGDRNGC